MTYAEAMDWMAYYRKYGGLGTAGRLETQLASVQAMIVNAMGGKASPVDFLPGFESDESEPSGIDIAQAIGAFQMTGAL